MALRYEKRHWTGTEKALKRKELTLPREVGEHQILGLKGNVGTLPGEGRKRANPVKERECEK